MFADAATSAQNSTTGFPSVSDVQLELSENTDETRSLREVHPCSTVWPPRSGTGRESTDDDVDSVGGAKPPEVERDCGVAHDAGMEAFHVQRTSVTESHVSATTSSNNTSVTSGASATPSLPPFFKDVATSHGVATAESLTTGAVNEATTTEVVDSSQVQGVGFAGESVASKAGCVCIIM